MKMARDLEIKEKKNGGEGRGRTGKKIRKGGNRGIKADQKGLFFTCIIYFAAARVDGLEKLVDLLVCHLLAEICED